MFPIRPSPGNPPGSSAISVTPLPETPRQNQINSGELQAPHRQATHTYTPNGSFHTIALQFNWSGVDWL
jgi:hypothetical protein